MYVLLYTWLLYMLNDTMPFDSVSNLLFRVHVRLGTNKLRVLYRVRTVQLVLVAQPDSCCSLRQQVRTVSSVSQLLEQLVQGCTIFNYVLDV